jgi:pimeloyl-ACP methyl ester carboxylesterase
MKMFLMIIKWILYILVGLLVLAFISLLAYRSYLKYTTKIKTPNGISSLEEITLGDLKQWIFIRGENKKNPVLIFLHGGPGAPLFGMSSSRKLDAELIKYFTVVHWDQRGAGKSYNCKIPVKSMTFNRLVEDCNELIDYVRNRFDIQKVFIVGHSGGSVVGIKTAYKYPEKIRAYVGVGQIINDYEQQKLSYNYIVEKAEKSGDIKKQIAIKAIGPPPYNTTEKLNQKDGYIFRYGGVLLDNSVKQMVVHMLSFLTSPEYSLSEGYATFTNKGFKFTTVVMWDEMRSINMTKEIKSIKVPIYFFEGKYDMATPTILVENFYNSLDAEKGKKLIIFENSAHLPMIEEKEKYEEFLVKKVLRESQNK